MSTRQPNSASATAAVTAASCVRLVCPEPDAVAFDSVCPFPVCALFALSRCGSGSKRFVSEVNVGSGVYAVALAESVGEPSVDAWIKAGSSISAALEVRLHCDDARFLTFPAMCVARSTMHVACSTIHARLRLRSCS